jgi:hypothetical protein
VSTAIVEAPLRAGELTKKELIGSRLYREINTPEKAAVVFKMARSYGLCETVIANGLYFPGGKPALMGQLMATIFRRSGKYTYRVRTKTDKKCEMEFFETVDGKRESLGVEQYTLEMAERSGVFQVEPELQEVSRTDDLMEVPVRRHPVASA